MKKSDFEAMAFANYLRDNHLKKPALWDEQRFEKFPNETTKSKMRDFVSLCIQENRKVALIESFLGGSIEDEYILTRSKDADKYAPIIAFFKAETKSPKEDTLNFIAAFFDAPMPSLSVFTEKQDLVAKYGVIEGKNVSNTSKKGFDSNDIKVGRDNYIITGDGNSLTINNTDSKK